MTGPNWLALKAFQSRIALASPTSISPSRSAQVESLKNERGQSAITEVGQTESPRDYFCSNAQAGQGNTIWITSAQLKLLALRRHPEHHSR